MSATFWTILAVIAACMWLITKLPPRPGAVFGVVAGAALLGVVLLAYPATG